MPNIVVVSSQTDRVQNLSEELMREGFECLIAYAGDTLLSDLESNPPDLMMLDFSGMDEAGNYGLLLNVIKDCFNCAVIGLLTRKSLTDVQINTPVDDFVIEPWDVTEVALRTRRALWRITNIENDSIIKYGDLVVDMDKYEVSVAGKPVNLSFKEYELLKVLISNKDKVMTRDALLDKVWGYDYFGGDRTVDVHIRRLRSKIEDAEHSFIDTVRNVGYRFRER